MPDSFSTELHYAEFTLIRCSHCSIETDKFVTTVDVHIFMIKFHTVKKFHFYYK